MLAPRQQFDIVGSIQGSSIPLIVETKLDSWRPGFQMRYVAVLKFLSKLLERSYNFNYDMK